MILSSVPRTHCALVSYLTTTKSRVPFILKQLDWLLDCTLPDAHYQSRKKKEKLFSNISLNNSNFNIVTLVLNCLLKHNSMS